MNLFGTPTLARGYATSRPPVHPHVIGLAAKRMGLTERLPRGLDVGCGAGLSTRALERIAARAVGLEPAAEMLQWTSTVAPEASFLVGSAESLPIRSASIDVITAAGSLNYVAFDRFFPEAGRVLRPGGLMIVYDFSEGRHFPNSTELDQWFAEFLRRYPWPPDSSQEVNPAILERVAAGFRVSAAENFEVGLTLSRDFYMDYVMTETNVGHALAHGATEQEIRTWIDDSLSFFRGSREVLFRGYFACLTLQ